MSDTDTSLSGSYRPEEIDLFAELARLRSQLALSWSEELRLLRGMGLSDGLSMIELGAGPGYVVEALASAFPTSEIVGVEVREDLLAEAMRGERSAQVTFCQASATDTGLPDGRFDVVVARLLLQHVEAPAAVTQEAFRLLKPGGHFVVVEMDAGLWGVAEPFSPSLGPIYAQAERLQLQRKGSRFLGRTLPRLLNAAGFVESRLEVFAYHSDALGVEAFREQMSPTRLLPALHMGLISDEQYALVCRETERFFENPMSFVMMLGFMAYGRRPSN